VLVCLFVVWRLFVFFFDVLSLVQLVLVFCVVSGVVLVCCFIFFYFFFFLSFLVVASLTLFSVFFLCFLRFEECLALTPGFLFQLFCLSNPPHSTFAVSKIGIASVQAVYSAPPSVLFAVSPPFFLAYFL